MQIWGLSDPGNQRVQNQDAYRIVQFGHDRALLLVCDGMGGAKSGNIASSLASEVFVGEVQRSQKLVMSVERIVSMMKSALELSNRAVYEQAQLCEDFQGMGTTLVAAYVTRSSAVIINVGDSRAYRLASDGVELLTTDHSLVAMMVQRGEISGEQAKNHPGKNLITRAVGTEPTVEGDVYVVDLKKEDTLLLCSDGLSNEMADQEMLFEVVHGEQKSDCCERLLNIVKGRGAPDNITVVLAVL